MYVRIYIYTILVAGEEEMDNIKNMCENYCMAKYLKDLQFHVSNNKFLKTQTHSFLWYFHLYYPWV